MLGTPHQQLMALRKQLYNLDKDIKPMQENLFVDYVWMQRSLR